MREKMVHEAVRHLAPGLPVTVYEVVRGDGPQAMNGWHPWHNHEEVEFLAVLEGRMAIETANDRFDLHPGSVLALGSLEPHRSFKREPVRYIVLQADLKTLLDFVPGISPALLFERPHPLSRFNAVYRDDEARRESFRLIRAIFEEASQRRRGFELAVGGYMRLLLLPLVRSGLAEAPPEWLRMSRVLEAIEERLSEPIAIRDMLPLVNLSYRHFMMTFKRCVGMSFVSYVHERRIKLAEKLLLTTELTNEDIAVRCGFATPAQFYAIFKRIRGCSPRQFRDGVPNCR